MDSKIDGIQIECATSAVATAVRELLHEEAAIGRVPSSREPLNPTLAIVDFDEAQLSYATSPFDVEVSLETFLEYMEINGINIREKLSNKLLDVYARELVSVSAPPPPQPARPQPAVFDDVINTERSSTATIPVIGRFAVSAGGAIRYVASDEIQF